MEWTTTPRMAAFVGVVILVVLISPSVALPANGLIVGPPPRSPLRLESLLNPAIELSEAARRSVHGAPGVSCSKMCVLANITVGQNPMGLAYDSAKREIYVANENCLTGPPYCGRGYVSVISEVTNTVVSVIYLSGSGTNASEPQDVTYDPAKGEVFVTNLETSNVSIINDTTNTVVGSIKVGDGVVSQPVGIAYDAGKHEIYVANLYDGNVSIINDSTDRMVGSFHIDFGAQNGSFSTPQIVYDSQMGELFVSSYGGHNVTVVNDTTNKAVKSLFFGVLSDPEGLAYDGGKGEVFVADAGNGNIDVISDSSNAVVSTVHLGSGAYTLGVTYDSGAGEVLAENYPNVTAINDSTNKVVGSITMPANPPGYGVYDPHTGNLYVSTNEAGGNVSVISLGIAPRTYPVSFSESGLLSGTNWTVDLNGTSLVSASATLNFTETNGTYPFSVPTVSGYAVAPSHGNVTVVGGNVTQRLTFTATSPSLSSVSVSPSTAYLAFNGTQVFSATPTCSGGNCPSGIAYAWSLNNSLGSLNSSTGNPVVFTAKTTPGNVTVYVNATLNGITKPGNPVSITVNSSSTPTLTAVSVLPTAPSVPVNGTQGFTATPACTSTCPGTVAYVWAVNNSLGSVNPTTGSATTFTAGPAAGSARLTVMATLNGVTKWTNATVTITPVVPVLSSVSISPTSITIGVGNSTSFTAHPNCTGGACPSGSTYSWSLQDGSLGSISPTSPGPSTTFTAGSTAGSEILYATASLNGVQQTGLAIINITKGAVPTLIGLALNPSPTALVQAGKSLTFNATPSCSVNPCPSGIVYNWVLNNTLGNLSSTAGPSVVFTAGASAGASSLTVTAQLNGVSKTATSDITITSSVVPMITGVTIVPGSATVQVNQGQSFTANASCSPGPCPSSTTYTWTLNNSLGSVTPSTGTSAQFTAGSSAGLVTLRVNATFNGKTVTSSIGITITRATPPPGNSTSPPTFLGLPGYDGYILLIAIAAVVVAAVVIALTRRKKAEAAPYPPGQ